MKSSDLTPWAGSLPVVRPAAAAKGLRSTASDSRTILLPFGFVWPNLSSGCIPTIAQPIFTACPGFARARDRANDFEQKRTSVKPHAPTRAGARGTLRVDIANKNRECPTQEG